MLRVLLILCVILFALSGCSVGIMRIGYSTPKDTAAINGASCNIAIKFQAKYSKDEVDVLGTIKSYATGLSINCGEINVLTIFYKDACAQRADIINIVEERQPDSWSTCYRAEAELIRLKDREKVLQARTDEKYSCFAPRFKYAANRESNKAIDAQKTEYDLYMIKLKERIEKMWKYPSESAKRSICGEAFIRFVIKKNGLLADVQVVQTTGHQDLDEAAIQAVKDGEPYWPLSDEWGKDQLTITGHFVYSQFDKLRLQ